MLLPSVVVMVEALARLTMAVEGTLVAEGGAKMDENMFKPLGGEREGGGCIRGVFRGCKERVGWRGGGGRGRGGGVY